MDSPDSAQAGRRGCPHPLRKLEAASRPLAGFYYEGSRQHLSRATPPLRELRRPSQKIPKGPRAINRFSQACYPTGRSSTSPERMRQSLWSLTSEKVNPNGGYSMGYEKSTPRSSPCLNRFETGLPSASTHSGWKTSAPFRKTRLPSISPVHAPRSQTTESTIIHPSLSSTALTGAVVVPEEAAILATSSSGSSAPRLPERGSSLSIRPLVTLPSTWRSKGFRFAVTSSGRAPPKLGVSRVARPPWNPSGERAW